MRLRPARVAGRHGDRGAAGQGPHARHLDRSAGPPPTHHPEDQLTLALDGLVEHVYGNSFIATNLDVSTPARAVAVEAWHRMRTDIEDRIRDAKHGAALRHLPSGNRAANTVWM